MLLAPPVCLQAETPKISLDTSETLFTVLTAINACGYDQELDSADPIRREVRSEIAKAIAASDEAAKITTEMCNFYHEHEQQDPSHELSQYVSLAFFLEAPPSFALKAKDSELPPDATRLVAFRTWLQKFYEQTKLHQIWLRHHDQYEALIDRYHEPLSKMMFNTDIYLKLPTAGYLGRQFTAFIEPMGAPGQTNARVYGTNYYIVVSPLGSFLKMEDIRHTYLHYVLDPLAMKRPEAMKRLTPLLDAVRTAPMDQAFKDDMSLLVTECLIRALEARTSSSGKTSEEDRQATVDKSMAQGFILTQYFYDALVKFEKGPIGFRDAYSDLLNAIDVRAETKRAANLTFADQASPDVLFLPQRGPVNLLVTAEKRLSAGDPASAKKLAQQALDENREDPGRALFILAQAATMNRDIEGARTYFQQALGVAKEPNLVAWSHIYLGRIFDLKEEREAALEQYRAALEASSSLPAAKSAAEKGLQQPYEPPVAPQPEQAEP